METDSDIEGDLARVLSCMGTNDREALIRQFQAILGDHSVTPEACQFFLDMSNWNLQSALGHYYDYGLANNVVSSYETASLNMQLVRDVTIGEGEAVPPNSKFIKTWRVRNSGIVPWPPGTSITFMEGAPLATENTVGVPPLDPGDEVEISVDMISPSESGIFQNRWQLNTFQRAPFGESIWCIITVDTNGILDITQQLATAPIGEQQNAQLNNAVAIPFQHNPFLLAHSTTGDEMDESEDMLPIQNLVPSNAQEMMGQGSGQANAFKHPEDAFPSNYTPPPENAGK